MTEYLAALPAESLCALNKVAGKVRMRILLFPHEFGWVDRERAHRRKCRRRDA